MRKDKEEALKLRSSGKSYNEISALLGVPKSTLSDWLKNHQWSREIGIKLAQKTRESGRIVLKELNIIRGDHLKNLYKQAEVEANEEFELLRHHPLFIAAMMIYWGEGDKLSRHRISVANTESAMLKVFVFFLKKICGLEEPKIHAWILAYPDVNIEESKRYWAKQTGLSESSFKKTMVIQGKPTTRKLTHGVCTVELNSTYFKTKMLIWLRRFSEELVSEEYYAGVV